MFIIYFYLFANKKKDSDATLKRLWFSSTQANVHLGLGRFTIPLAGWRHLHQLIKKFSAVLPYLDCAEQGNLDNLCCRSSRMDILLYSLSCQCVGFGCCGYLLDLVLCSCGCLAFLRVAQSGLWDGLRYYNGLVALTELNTCNFLTASFFYCILHAVILDRSIFVWVLGWFVGGQVVNLFGCIEWWYFLL